jgi:hypothetical protein
MDYHTERQLRHDATFVPGACLLTAVVDAGAIAPGDTPESPLTEALPGGPEVAADSLFEDAFPEFQYDLRVYRKEGGDSTRALLRMLESAFDLEGESVTREVPVVVESDDRCACEWAVRWDTADRRSR